jgi:type IV pilus assembly protein PilM
MFWRKDNRIKRDLVVGLDLGARQLKAVALKRSDKALTLAEYVVSPSSATASRAGAVDQFGAELQALFSQLGVTERSVRVTMSSSSATVCETEVPRMPIEEVRAALRLPTNCMRYLRRDLSNFCLDVVELIDPARDDNAKKSPTMRVLIAGATRDEVFWCRDALMAAKIKPETLELAAISVINAFQLTCPGLSEKEAIVLIDIGAHSTSINCLRGGRLQMARIMQFGGRQISEFVGSMLTLQPAAAEEEKVKMSEAVQPLVRQAISPLAREVRSSIDFFERQHECHVTRAYACGGSACSPKILEFLSEEVGFHLECWNPLQNLDITHFNGDGPKLTNLAPSLAAAIGVAAPLLY